MADRTLQILPGGQSAAPFVYPVPASTGFTLMGVRAVFDGAAAAGAFLPCVQLVSDAGVVMAETTGKSVAAGGSADVTFAPFLDDQSGGSSGGGGILFDTVDPATQQGVFLFTHTTGNTTLHVDGSFDLFMQGGGSEIGASLGVLTLASTAGLHVNDVGTAGVQLHSQDGGAANGLIQLTTASGQVIATGASLVNQLVTAAGNPAFEVRYPDTTSLLRMRSNGDSRVRLQPGGSFFVVDDSFNTILSVNNDGTIDAPTLPTVDPGVSGRLWNNAGVVTVSP